MPAPGPAALGRGVVIDVGGAIPAPWITAAVLTVDEPVLRSPAEVVDRLHRAWAERLPVVVELAVDPARFREPTDITVEAWRFGPASEPWFDRLHFLVWTNNYDARRGVPVWWWARKAVRLGAVEVADGAEQTAAPGTGAVARPHEGVGDVVLADGSAVWVDGGPRQPWSVEELDGVGFVHHESVEQGVLALGPEPAEPSAVLAPDQLAAVAHRRGPARVIAPAGSGKTRVLTERLRHLLGDRGWERSSVLAVAYNKEAQLELERRTAAFAPRVRTLNSLGLWVLAQHRGRAPALFDERACRGLVDSILPGRRRHRANTDPIGPYLEALGAIRLGLRDPDAVEAERDDVDGLAQLFAPYRHHLAEQAAVDFDDQIYSALEALLGDGTFRRRMQQRCRHLLVDEFQDLTPAHVLLIRLLALPALDVFGVGDDDQTINGHVGADPAFLIDYATLFPSAGDHPLTVNYRCPVEVVTGARTLLGYNHRRVVKAIEAGPVSDRSSEALRVVLHGPDDGAATTVSVIEDWLGDTDIEPGSIAVLARVNSVLLAPQVALAEAGLPVDSVLGPHVLERTGMRAALAYLRLAAASDAMAAGDIVEILRRPTRGLPQWFPDRLGRRGAWSVPAVRSLADQVPDKEAAKVLHLADDLAAVAASARGGSTREVLEVVRDEIGLGTAMGMLDRTGAGLGSSHLDDLEGLLGVADLHPDLAGFEAWLRSRLGRPREPAGVTLSTIHRVKGREWDRVLVFGVSAGLVPHRLSDDIEEERRVLHVAITRGRHRVAVLADRSRRSPLLAELAGTAPMAPAPEPDRAPPRRVGEQVEPLSKDGGDAGAAGKRSKPGPVEVISAERGRTLKVLGGHQGTVTDADGRSARLALPDGAKHTVRYGERVEHVGIKAPLAPPAELWGPAASAEALLRAWRSERSKADGVAPYLVLSDAHLRGIALARPGDAAALHACDGIGPTKLDRYGDDILARLDQIED